MRYVSGLLANKYILTIFIFFIWMLFFDKNNWITLGELQDTIDAMEEEKAFYDDELKLSDERMRSIQIDRERYAREKFFLHKENEIVYIIR